jgi:hypothetical protein
MRKKLHFWEVSMAVTGTLAKGRKWKWVIYMIVALCVGLWGIYDGWFNPAFKVAEKANDRLFSQVLGIALPTLFLVLFVGFFVIRKMRVVVDEKGISVNDKLTIAWDSITDLDASREEKGLLDIFYQKDGKKAKYVLDNYKVDHFEEMLDEISLHRPDLLAPVEEEAESRQDSDDEEKE